MTRLLGRRDIARMAGGMGAGLLLASCHQAWKLDPQDVAAGTSFKPLKFTLTDAATGKMVTQADFRGKIVMLYFGYTHCPNVCPLTLSDTVHIFRTIGAPAQNIRFLFVTVDPGRDTLSVLHKYVALFGSTNIIGLRGTEAQLGSAAARCDARYTVHPSADPADYTVTHTPQVYVFNRQGAAEFMILGLSSQNPDLKGIAADLSHLVGANSA